MAEAVVPNDAATPSVRGQQVFSEVPIKKWRFLAKIIEASGIFQAMFDRWFLDG